MGFDVTSRGYALAGIVMIAAGLVSVLLFGFPWLLGFAAVVVGLALVASPVIINGLAGTVSLLWHSAEPAWEGETLYTQDDRRIRYGFDSQGAPWFVAKDVCRAINASPPGKGKIEWGGGRLVMRQGMSCFTEQGIAAYLAPYAINNGDARRLLVLVQQQVMRKVDDSRDKARRYS